MKRILVAVLSLLCWLGAPACAAEGQATAADLAKIKVLNLKIAQSLALAGNPSMEAAQSRIEQARARVSQAAANWWPSLDLKGSADRVRTSNNSYQESRGLAALLGGTADQTTDYYATGVRATWVLFDGFYRTFKEQQEAYGEQSAEAALVDSRRLLVTSVAEAFLNAQLAQTYIDISRADETFYTRQLEDAQNRYNVGAGPWGDVLNIKVQLNSAKTSLIRSQREFEAAGYGLAALLGLSDAAFPPHLRLESLDKDAPISEQKEKAETLITEALKARPDIRRLEMVVKQADAATGVAKAPFYPKVQVAGSVEGIQGRKPGADQR